MIGTPWLRFVYLFAVFETVLATIALIGALLRINRFLCSQTVLTRSLFAGAVAAIVLTPMPRAYLYLLAGIDFSLYDLPASALRNLVAIIIVVYAVTQFRILREKASEPRRQAGGAEQQSPVAAPLYMEAEDHYVKLVWENSVEIRRMSLADAMRAWEGKGVQIHRSYWVSFPAIEGRLRKGRNLAIRLRNGAELPVGRSFEKKMLKVFRADAASAQDIAGRSRSLQEAVLRAARD